MTRSMRSTQSLLSRSRRLNLEALEPRICLSTYTTIDLFPLPGDDRAEAWGLNDNGLVVGRSGSPSEPVVWSVSPTGQVAVAPLPGVGGGTAIGTAMEVNNQGMIAGDSVVTIDGSTYGHAVVWTGTFGSHVAHDLGTLDGFAASWASSISEPDSNGNVWVVGNSWATVERGVLWQVDVNGTVLTMTDLEPYSSGASAYDVKVIGDSVFVAGQADVQAVIWEVGLDGVVVGSNVLGTAEYSALRANALNNDGDVVGWGWEVGTAGRHGYLYDNDGGVITDLGAVGEMESEA